MKNKTNRIFKAFQSALKAGRKAFLFAWGHPSFCGAGDKVPGISFDVISPNPLPKKSNEGGSMPPIPYCITHGKTITSQIRELHEMWKCNIVEVDTLTDVQELKIKTQLQKPESYFEEIEKDAGVL